MSAAVRKIVVILLLLFGVELWLIIGASFWGTQRQLLLLLACVVISCIPWLARPIARALERLRNPSRPAKICIALCLVPLAAWYLYASAIFQHRDFAPLYHDEFMFRLQTQMLAHGRLWMPAHPLGDFFDTFYVFVNPVYAAQSFPGAAILYLPTVWFHFPSWVMPLIVCSAVVAAWYLVVTEITSDGLAGLLAAIMLASLPTFRMISVMYLAQGPMLLLGIVILGGFLRWSRSLHRLTRPSIRWSLLLGFFGGWAIITRPLDALFFMMPIGISILLQLRRSPMRRWLATFGVLFAGAAPFLILQAIFNVGVTGSVLKSPFALYNDRDQPALHLGFGHADLSQRPMSTLQQKQDFYDTFYLDPIRQHTPLQTFHLWMKNRLPFTMAHILPSVLLLVLMPTGWAGLRRNHSWVALCGLPLFVIGYMLYPIFTSHYTIIAAPAATLNVALALVVLPQTFPRAKNFLLVLLTGAILVTSLMNMPQFNRLISDQEMTGPSLQAAAKAEAQLRAKNTPAIVLFHYSPNQNPNEEPVYNPEVTWPDDAVVIRAHDLGDRDIELYRYYAARQPDRTVYRFDRTDNTLTYLGTAKELVSLH